MLRTPGLVFVCALSALASALASAASAAAAAAAALPPARLPPALELDGIVTVLNTPFTADAAAVDRASLVANVALAIRSGVSGFLVPALAAEVNQLSRAEREGMVRAVVQLSPSNITVICGVYGVNPAERLSYAKAWLAAGCTGILIKLPFSSGTGNASAVFVQEVKSIASIFPQQQSQNQQVR